MMSTKSENRVRTKAILSLLRGLWGEISPSLRSASIKIEKKKIHLFFYFDGPISEEDYESSQVAVTEVIADFPNCEFDITIERVDLPTPLPIFEMGALVYMRREKMNPRIVGEFHKYLGPLVEVIRDLQDEAYQERVWLKGIGLEVDSFGESINTFFDLYDPIRDELGGKKYKLTRKQVRMIHDLANMIINHGEDLPIIVSFKDVVNTAGWHEIRDFAKEVYAELTKWQSCR